MKILKYKLNILTSYTNNECAAELRYTESTNSLIRLWNMKVIIRHTVSSFLFAKALQLSPRLTFPQKL